MKVDPFQPTPFAEAFEPGYLEPPVFVPHQWCPVSRYTGHDEALELSQLLRGHKYLRILTAVHAHDGVWDVYGWSFGWPEEVRAGQIWQNPETGRCARLEVVAEDTEGRSVVVFRAPRARKLRVSLKDDLLKTYSRFFTETS